MSIVKCSKNPEHDFRGTINAKFCPDCGAVAVYAECECGNLLNDHQKFCENCGKEVKRESDR